MRLIRNGANFQVSIELQGNRYWVTVTALQHYPMIVHNYLPLPTSVSQTSKRLRLSEARHSRLQEHNMMLLAFWNFLDEAVLLNSVWYRIKFRLGLSSCLEEILKKVCRSFSAVSYIWATRHAILALPRHSFNNQFFAFKQTKVFPATLILS